MWLVSRWADHWNGNAQDAPGGERELSERAQADPGLLNVARRGEAFQKYSEMRKDAPRKRVKIALAMVATTTRFGRCRRGKPEQFQLSDVGILKLVHQD